MRSALQGVLAFIIAFDIANALFEESVSLLFFMWNNGGGSNVDKAQIAVVHCGAVLLILSAIFAFASRIKTSLFFSVLSAVSFVLLHIIF